MSQLTIKCPNCADEFPLSGDLLTSVRAEISDKLTAKVKEREEKLKQDKTQLEAAHEQLHRQQQDAQEQVKKAVAQATAEKEATLLKEAEKLEQQQTRLQAQENENEERLKKAIQEQVAQRESKMKEQLLELQAGKDQLLSQQSQLQEQINEKVAAQLQEQEGKLIQKAKEAATKDAQLELDTTRKQLGEKEAALKKSQAKELDFLQEKQALQDEKDQLKLTVARTLDQERAKLVQQTQNKADEENNLRVAEKEKTINELKEQLQNAQRKAEQGSQQGQGEVLEMALEEHLRQTYPRDIVSPIKTGANGADISLFVESQDASEGRHLLFELKNTKTWQPKWITKLKDDMQKASANQGLIITRALPEGVNGFGIRDGVWVCDFPSAKSLIPTLRAYLLEVHRARNLQEGAKDKAQKLYDYITSDAYRQRVFQISSHFQSMREEMNQERAYLEKKWASRETHIQNIISNLNGITGSTEALTETPSLTSSTT